VHVRRFGSGTPVVLVHGLAVSGAYLVPLAHELADGFRVLVPDLPGYGRSPKPASALGPEELADAVAGLLDGATHVVGNSFGCEVAVQLAVLRPELVDRLVLIGPTTDPAARTPWDQIARFLVDAPREPLLQWWNVVRDTAVAGAPRVVRTFGHSLRHRMEDVLPLVQAPTLVLRGERDPIAPQRWAEEAARLLPEGEVAIVPLAAHVPHYSHPAETAAVVRRFLG